ncbi:MAG: M48 family metalloprotease [Pseudomonadota bacterium]
MKSALLFLILCLSSQLLIASELPDLSDVSQGAFSPHDEARVGSEIMRDIRAEPTYYDDPELTDYLNDLGYRLVAASPGNRISFQFFVLRDHTLNAFALPGGFIGVHTGLIEAAQNESELAGVLGHEIAHVTQHHLARMIENQNQGIIPSLAALAVAILAARSNPQVATAAIATVQATTIQKQLNFSRDNEREADRIGMQIMRNAGFDPRAMATFFEHLQKNNRLYENNAPAYLLTHPLTSERIADMQNRAATMPVKQIADSLAFQLIRARLLAGEGHPEAAVKRFSEAIRDTRYSSLTAERFGLAVALLRARQFDRAELELNKLNQSGVSSPLIAMLGARIKEEAGDLKIALVRYQAGRARFPGYRPLLYADANALLQAGKADAALTLVSSHLTLYADDYRLYALQSRAYAMQGKDFLHHYAQAEAYVRQGNLDAAIEQLKLALLSKDGDFYQMSIAEARVKELITLNKPNESLNP